MATARNSVLYNNTYVLKQLSRGGDPGGEGRVVALPFEFLAASPVAINDTYNVCVIRGGYRVIGLECTTDGLGASTTVQLGDVGNTSRYMTATSFATTGLAGTLAPTGAGYTPTADVIVVATIAGAAPTLGKRVVGVLYCIPGA